MSENIQKTPYQLAEEYSRLEAEHPDQYLAQLFAGEINTGYPCVDKPWAKFYTPEIMDPELPKMTVVDYLKSHPEMTKGKKAVSYYGNAVSYEEFFRKLEEAARVLTSMGVRKGDRILVMIPNIPEAIYLFYGASMIGAVSDYIDPRPDSVDLKVSARKTLSLYLEEGCSHVITLDSCYLAMIQPNEAEWKEHGVNQILVVTPADSMNLKAQLTYARHEKKLHGKDYFNEKMEQNKKMSAAFEAAKAASILDIIMYKDAVKATKNVKPDFVEYEPNMDVAITHTSGTTGRPKPVPMTHDALNCYVEQAGKTAVPIRSGDRFLFILPFFAAYGIANLLHPGLGRGTTMVCVPEIGPMDFGKLIVLNKASFVAGIPSWCTAMANDPWMEGKDLSYMNWLSAGGTTISAEEEDEINSFLAAHGANIKLSKGHGMSETAGAATLATNDYNEPGSLGIPLPNTIYAIVDPETKEMLRFEDGQDELEGELIISSPCVTSGTLGGTTYVTKQDYFGKEYILTGDIARLRRDGVMHFDSRGDRGFARFDGFNVRPGKLEEVIESFDSVRLCAISPYFDKTRGGNMIKANLVLSSGVELDTEGKVALIEQIVNEGFIENSDLSSRQIPAKFAFLPELPMTPGGKLDSPALNQMPLTGEEITVILDETNISLNGVRVIPPER